MNPAEGGGSLVDKKANTGDSNKDHEDHIAERGFNAMTHENFVHDAIPETGIS